MRKTVVGSVWVEFSEEIDGTKVRKTVKADNTDLVLIASSTVEDLGDRRTGQTLHSFEVRVPGFKAEL